MFIAKYMLQNNIRSSKLQTHTNYAQCTIFTTNQSTNLSIKNGLFEEVIQQKISQVWIFVKCRLDFAQEYAKIAKNI